MSRFISSIGLAICVLLVGCDEAAMLKSNALLQDEPVARNYLDMLMAGKVDELQKDLDPTVVGFSYAAPAAGQHAASRSFLICKNCRRAC
jgi:hypothetical protein